MASLTLRQFRLFFLLILPCWRVFFLGSPALHYAGTDRLQKVGVRSLHVDPFVAIGFLVFIQEWPAVFYPRQLLKYFMTGSES